MTPLTEPRPRPPDDTIHLAVSGVQSSYTWACIFWLKVTAASRTGADLATLLTAIKDSWNSRLQSLYVTTCTPTEFKGVWITPGGGEIVGSATSNVPGTASGGPVQNLATALVVNWRIDQYYRGGKPRSYQPGIPASATTDNVHFTSTYLASALTGWGSWRTDVNALTAGAISNVKLGTVSFQSKKEWRDPPVFYQYNGASIRSVLGTQRRRLLT